MNSLVVFHHQLFKVSEPFISQQGGALLRYSPLYLGRQRFGEAPPGVVTHAVQDLPNQRSVWARLNQVLTRDVRPYRQLLRDERPALIHAHFGVDAVYALPLARQLNVPLVTTFHGFDATTSNVSLLRSGSPAWINYLVFRKQLAMRGQLFLCVSEYIRRRVLALGFPAERTHVHYIGIDTDNVRPRQAEMAEPVVLHVARLTEKKGTEFLIRAFAALPSSLAQYKLVIIGEGPLRLKLERLAIDLGVAERVSFLGAQPHESVLAWMRRAATLVLPSVVAATGDAEGLGMVLLEAAALGVPVVGTQHGGIPEVVVDGQTGFLVPERDVDALTSRLQALLQNDGLRLQMGVAARRLVETRFDIRKQTAKLEKFYDGVLE